MLALFKKQTSVQPDEGGAYKNELEQYTAKLRSRYRTVVENLPRDKKERLGWSVTMGFDGLTARYEGLPTIKRYIDTWYKNRDINKSYFELDKGLIEKSHRFHRVVLQAFCDSGQMTEYEAPGAGDVVNTLDYQLVTQITKDTGKKTIEKIMDFGAGYGREANLFAQHPDCREYTIIEAIEDSYVVQSAYLKIAADNILENCAFNESLLTDPDFISPARKLNHLLTCDMSRIPAEHFDLVICSNVLNEITGGAFVFVIKEIARVLRTGGIFYIKDHGLADQCGHQYYDHDVLETLNFALEYRPFVEDLKDIWTVPRIYRKYGSNRPSFLTPMKHIEPFPG